MGGMAAPDNKTSPENELSEAPDVDRGKCPCHADQDALGRQFANHPDPHVRIIAHMSNRQLALSEKMGDTTKMLFKVAGVVHALQEQSSTTNLELRRMSDSLLALTASVEKLVEAVGMLTVQHTELAARTEELEESAGLGACATIPPSC